MQLCSYGVVELLSYELAELCSYGVVELVM